MDINIREIDTTNKNDLYLFAKLHQESPIEWDKDHVVTEDSISRRMILVQKEKESCVLFAADGQKVVGIYWILLTQRNRKKAALIGSLWVHKEYRRQKIATKMMEQGEKWAIDKKAELSYLNVHYNNQVATNYYTENGFSAGYVDMVKELPESKNRSSRIEVQFEEENNSSICENILRSLPDWFGIESAIVQYMKDVQELPMVTAKLDNKVVGFIAYRKHFTNSYEIHVMGVLPEFHRRGVGKELVRQVELEMRKEGAMFLQVKTLSPSRESDDYGLTREFYVGVGFTPLEEFKTLWGEDNPCLLMIKRV